VFPSTAARDEASAAPKARPSASVAARLARKLPPMKCPESCVSIAFLSSGIGFDGLERDFNRIQDVLQNLFSFFIAPSVEAARWFATTAVG
jgi:hypothetical protein